MNRKPLHISKGLVKLAILAVFATGMLSRCAQIAMPQGGPRDTLPPKVVNMTPAFGTTDFKGKRIYIEFDEYVQIKDQQKEFFTSPFMTKKPSLVLKGRGVQIDLQDTLLPDQTYALNFGQSIADNNEGNPYVGLRYVFSTGPKIDSMLMSGYCIDAQTCDTAGNSFILFFDPAADSVPGCDSTLYNSQPLAVGKAFPNGIFLAENLKPIPYRIFALEDNNGNQLYEPGVDRVAFLDSVCNPLDMPPFNVWYDTTRNYLQAQPQVLMRLFMEPPVRRQAYTSGKRIGGNKIELYFGAPFPRIEELTLEGIDPARIQTEYLTHNRDSMFLWIDSTGLSLPDTLRGRLIYQKQDSLRNYFTDTVSLKLGWKAPAVKESKKKEKEEEKKVNPFKVSVTPSGTVNPEKHILFSFSAPLVTLDSSAIQLEMLPEDDKKTAVKVPVSFTRDTFKLKDWVLKAEWKPGEKYRLLIPDQTFRNVNGETNDTLKADFGIEMPDKFATLLFNVQGETPESQYIIELIDENGKILDQKNHLTTGKHTFRYVPAGNIRVRVVDDRNRNGKWDTGSVLESRQPERVEMFVAPDGQETIIAKVNWEVEYDINMNELFAPVTMERMEQIIGRWEAVRQKKLTEEREAAQKKNQDTHNHGNQNSGYGNQNSGFGNQGYGNQGYGNQNYGTRY